MSMVKCVICKTLGEPVESTRIDGHNFATIRKVIYRFSDGRRQTRYTVCTGNVIWATKDDYTLNEARAEVRRLKEEAEQAKYYAMYI